MRMILSTILAVALLLGLGALAVLALPHANAPLAAAPAAYAPQPRTLSARAVYNVIGMPLAAASQFDTAGFGFDSDGLATLVGPSVKQVLRWNAQRQDFDSWDPVYKDGILDGNPVQSPWALTVGGAYWLLVDKTAPAVASFVGDVPAANSVKFTLAGSGADCSYNQITIPLEQSSLTNAHLLATGIAAKLQPSDAGQVSRVLQWNATRQGFDWWDPSGEIGFYNGSSTGTPWAVRIGYPYMVCLRGGLDGMVWP